MEPAPRRPIPPLPARSGWSRSYGPNGRREPGTPAATAASGARLTAFVRSPALIAGGGDAFERRLPASGSLIAIISAAPMRWPEDTHGSRLSFGQAAVFAYSAAFVAKDESGAGPFDGCRLHRGPTITCRTDTASRRLPLQPRLLGSGCPCSRISRRSQAPPSDSDPLRHGHQHCRVPGTMPRRPAPVRSRNEWADPRARQIVPQKWTLKLFRVGRRCQRTHFDRDAHLFVTVPGYTG